MKDGVIVGCSEGVVEGDELGRKVGWELVGENDGLVLGNDVDR